MLRRVAHDYWKVQHPVARYFGETATFRSVKDWTKWYERAREAKDKSRKSDADLAATVSDVTKRKAGRAQVNHWFTGKREPTISQYIALCADMGADPGTVLFGVPVLPDATGPEIAKALAVDPTKKASYKMQEKRMKMRRTVRPTTKKRRPVTA